MKEQDEIYYIFESFRVDVGRRRLLRGEENIPLTAKAFNTLLFLIRHQGKTATKNDLMDAVWFDTAVEENNLTQQISTLRKLLGERAGEYRFIATVPKQGYSFIAPVKEVTGVEIETENKVILQEYAHSNITIDISGQKESETKQIKRLLPAFPAYKISRSVQVTVLVLFGLFAVIGAAALWSNLQNPTRTSEKPTTIAVLPFKILNNQGTERDDFLGAGMSDTLTAKLGNIQGLTVRPSNSVMKIGEDHNQDPVAAGRTLRVDAVLDGTVQRSGDRIRVTVQMLEVESAKIVWGQSFDENFSEVFNLQDAISADIAQALKVKLSDKEQKEIRKHSTDNVEAFQAYMRGRFFWNKRDEDDLIKGIGYFEQATTLDPNYALAYSGIADSYLILDYYHLGTLSHEENLSKAKQSAQKSLELNDSIAESHTSLAFIEFYGGNPAAAEREFKRAIELNPNYATAHHWYSAFLAEQGRAEEALREIKIAANLDPVSPIINTTLGESLYLARHYDEAVLQLRRTIEIDDNFFTAHYILGMVYEQQGAFNEAFAEFQKARSLTKDTGDFDSVLAHLFAQSGNRAEAQKILNRLIKNRAYPQAIAIVYAGLGENAQAIEWFKKTDVSKSKWFLTTDPRLDSLRSDKDFQQIFNFN